MGHVVSKDVYGRLARKMDNLHVRAPWNAALQAILNELVSPDEADLIIRMPFLFSGLDRVAKITRMSADELKPVLERLCEKGFVMDLLLDGDLPGYTQSMQGQLGL